jgi:hypothetical protein
MKRVLLFLLIAVFAIPTFQSCKKGENDPAISFKSRKARLVGEWELTEGTITRNWSGTTIIYTYNGTTVSVSTGGSNNYTQSIVIDKDGTYELTTIDNGTSTVDIGQWYFMEGNKDKDLKAREAVAFVVTTRTVTPPAGSPTITTYVSVVPDYVWQLDELSSKELIIIYDESTTGGTTNSFVGTLTFTKK